MTTAQSTASIGWSFTPGNKTGTPSTTGGITNYAASTWTDNATANSGTATAWTGHSFQRPTLAASNTSVTTTDAATVYVANSPLAGSNETLTNAWALWIDAGNVRFDDNIHWLSGTAFAGIFDHANAADRTYTFPDATGNVPVVASQAEVNAMTSTTTAVSPNANTIVIDTIKASTSGSSVDFTGIPAGVRRITITFAGVSLSGTDDILVQIGDAGGLENSGYIGSGTFSPNGSSPTALLYTTGFGILTASAANVLSGSITLTLIDEATFAWSCSGSLGRSNSAGSMTTAGSKSLTATLDRVSLIVTGANTFDAGSVNIVYER